MLQMMRNALKSWAGKVLIGLFILPFLFLGAETLFSALSGSNYAVEINGEGIVEQQIAQGIENNKQRYRQQFGESFDMSLFSDELLRESAINQLVEEELIKQYAEDNNLSVSFAKLSEILRSTPMFADETGEFSQEVFETIVAQQGLTTKRAIEIYKQRVSSFQPTEAISGSGFVLNNDFLIAEQLKKQKRDFSYLSLDIDELKSSITPTDEEVEAYYTNNIDQYKTEETLQVEYVEIKLSDLNSEVQISEEQVLSRFETEKADRLSQLRRRVSHILIAIDDNTSESEALTKITELEEKLTASENFESLAKEFSSDIASAKEGGDLGFANRGDFDPEFEDSLFSLELGEISEPVLTEFGYHLIKFSELESAEEFTFEAEKARIESSIQSLALQDLFQDKIASIEDIVFESSDLNDVALDTGLEIKVSQFFSRSAGQGIANSQAIRDLAFSDEILNQKENSSVVEVSEGHAVALRLKDHRLVANRPLEEVKSSVIESIKSDTAKEQLAEKKDAILLSLEEEGVDLDQLASEQGLAWIDVKEAQRDSSSAAESSDTPREIIEEVFKMAKPKDDANTISSQNYGDGSVAIIKLSKVHDTSEVLSEEDLAKARESLERSQGNREWIKHVAYLRDQSEVVIKDSATENEDLSQ